jgi:RluA family pseudouridine synthase
VEWLMIHILFETTDILAVDKPEGLASIHEQGKDCLLSLLSTQFPEKLYVVHRLDKEVSGVILFARNAPTHKFLTQQFSGHTVDKTYIALVQGVIQPDSGVIDRPLREFGSGRVSVDVDRGKPSRTEFRVVERFEAHTLIKVHPRTGRRHQIRAHLYSGGHSLVGDLRYGDKAMQSRFPRLMLHSQRVTFRLLSGEAVTVEAPLPASFLSVIERIRQVEHE